MRLSRLLFCLVILAPAAAAQSDADRWNLTDLFPDVASWSRAADQLEQDLAGLAGCKGHLADDAATLKRCFDQQTDMAKRLNRLYVYASEMHNGDTGDTANLELQQKAQLIFTRLRETTSFVEPELLRAGREKITALMQQEPGLAVYRQPLEEVLHRAPHTLDDKGESLLAAFSFAGRAGASTYGILTNADMPWPTIKLADGSEARLDQSGYTRHREAANREDRKRVMDAFFGALKGFERTLGVTYYSSVKEDVMRSRVRDYSDTLVAALDGKRIPREVHDTLIRETNANLPTLHRYFRLRARMLGVPEMRYYDIYPPLVASQRKFGLDVGKRLMLESVAPLGSAYSDTLREAANARWMDVYPRPRKLSGAHMSGAAYDVHPYLLLNYNDDYESVSTLTHEWGHAMHSVLSNRAQPFATAGYPIFIAEIASTLNEALLLDHMLKIAKDDDERLLYLGSALEQLRATFFRQAMFAEFERDAHARVERGETLSGSSLSRMYGELLRRYHGEAQGVVKIDDTYTIEWAYIPHFYNAYYVYQYATSIAASSLFADRIVRKEPGALDRYLTLLQAGGSDYPYELVKRAGVDLASPEPYRALVGRMNAIMDEIESILARRGR
ncbi:MAG: oligoendopeptidase F [Pseudomonadota bacterium]|nr:oligoendopeptidase F [Pseudomonadota bacterium]